GLAGTMRLFLCNLHAQPRQVANTTARNLDARTGAVAPGGPDHSPKNRKYEAAASNSVTEFGAYRDLRQSFREEPSDDKRNSQVVGCAARQRRPRDCRGAGAVDVAGHGHRRPAT